MSFLLPAIGGLLGNMLFKKDGGAIAVPQRQSKTLQALNPKGETGGQAVMPMVMPSMLLKNGGRVKGGKKKRGKK